MTNSLISLIAFLFLTGFCAAQEKILPTGLWFGKATDSLSWGDRRDTADMWLSKRDHNGTWETSFYKL